MKPYLTTGAVVIHHGKIQSGEVEDTQKPPELHSVFIGCKLCGALKSMRHLTLLGRCALHQLYEVVTRDGIIKSR